MPSIFDTYDLAGLPLANRIVMAPMTRSRAVNDDAADEMTATYYAQRASAGLIISEGTQISRQGQGYLWTPGIYTPVQIEGWRKVTSAVHAKGGKIFAQLWHVGRSSHVSLQENYAAPVSSVDTQVSERWPVFAYDRTGKPSQVPASAARALTIPEIHAIIEEFAQAARNAVAAGFDGIELHSAGAYLPDNFINGAINTRTDEYGGPKIENRLRFVLETMDAMIAAIGAGKVAIRISPEGRIKDNLPYKDERETFLTLASELSKRGIAFIHINDQDISRAMFEGIRKAFDGTLLITGGLTKESAQKLLDEDMVDLVGFGRPFIGNPDLVERLQKNWPLAVEDKRFHHGGGKQGYIDYPNYSG
jgi:N-ethylmaleimide reductase